MQQASCLEGPPREAGCPGSLKRHLGGGGGWHPGSNFETCSFHCLNTLRSNKQNLLYKQNGDKKQFAITKKKKKWKIGITKKTTNKYHESKKNGLFYLSQKKPCSETCVRALASNLFNPQLLFNRRCLPQKNIIKPVGGLRQKAQEWKISKFWLKWRGW